MPSYATGDNNLDAALVNLGSAMFPSAKDKLTAQYRAAAAGKAQAAAEKTRMEAKLLAEQHAQQSKLVPLLGDHLVQQNLGNEPGISTDIAGPAVPGLYAKEDFLRAAPGAVLAGGGTPHRSPADWHACWVLAAWKQGRSPKKTNASARPCFRWAARLLAAQRR